MSLERILADAFPELDSLAVSRFRTYHDELVRKNSLMNLTAITGEDEIARLHFLDSLAILELLDSGSPRVIDIGSGAGFPGLPMIIARPDIRLTLLDARQKRVSFLAELCKALCLDNTRCVCARAEEFSREGLPARESFDVAVSRAVAGLRTLCELCLPFVAVGGSFIAMKSRDSDEEIDAALCAITTLGGGGVERFDYTIPGTDILRRAVIVRKLSPTPQAYPRRFSRIQKQPL